MFGQMGFERNGVFVTRGNRGADNDRDEDDTKDLNEFAAPIQVTEFPPSAEPPLVMRPKIAQRVN